MSTQKLYVESSRIYYKLNTRAVLIQSLVAIFLSATILSFVFYYYGMLSEYGISLIEAFATFMLLGCLTFPLYLINNPYTIIRKMFYLKEKKFYYGLKSYPFEDITLKIGTYTESGNSNNQYSSVFIVLNRGGPTLLDRFAAKLSSHF